MAHAHFGEKDRELRRNRLLGSSLHVLVVRGTSSGCSDSLNESAGKYQFRESPLWSLSLL